MAFGRSGELKPGDVFPSLKELKAAVESEDDDPDPRDMFDHFSRTHAGRIIRQPIKPKAD